MNTSNDISVELQAQVKQAISDKQALFIHGGNSKQFFGNPVRDTPTLDVSPHTGVINYEPTELCITVRAGTKLSELESLLAENNQILPFEPPHYLVDNKNTATIGGAIASGIAGPRRAFSGSTRDSILGVEIINGVGEIVRFGGEVMKNVAGYDLSRMMVRSQGTLGVLLNVSIRLLPKPEEEMTLVFDASQAEALDYFQQLRKQLLPITATTWLNDEVSIRLGGTKNVLSACKDKLKGDEISSSLSSEFWQSIRDQSHPFFNSNANGDKPLWRFSVPPATAEISQLDGAQLLEWNGAQRWLHTHTPANILQEIAHRKKGYATLFRTASRAENNIDVPRFPELEANLFTLHKQLKKQMDPQGIFNPNRIYRGL